MIHTFGDSHASKPCWNDCYNVIPHHIGPILCYSFGKDPLSRCNIKNYGLKNNDSVIFCFGEIDCRCHVNKHITNSRSYKDIINEIVENYIEAININLKNINLKLKYICIYNIIPPVQRYNTEENKYYPFVGSDEERKKYVLYFNECLKVKCKQNNWIFFDVYEAYSDNNGYLDKHLSDGSVHIKDTKYIKEFIKNNMP